jgi:UDP-N-acetyl-D-glucosamine/UDP-N-acetyl-D-galactosamine dehydrogenase
MAKYTLKNKKLAVVGLGYVGLPLAVEFGKSRQVVGFDVDEKRILELQAGIDHTLETKMAELKSATHLSFSNQVSDISNCTIFIITVPTPIDNSNNPDLKPLLSASETVGKVLKNGDIVIYESTVYPGCTEEKCVPVLEKHSGLTFNKEFFCGYSPERINPGDKKHCLTSIKKVTSGSTPDIAQAIDDLYDEIITAGTYCAQSIIVAEAAKVIENVQRDVNIALVNEFSMIFKKMNIDTEEVLKAAETKWNFLPFRPGLVGGHCIGVDPYYLAYKSQMLGHHPKLILAGRSINDSMAQHVIDLLFKRMEAKGIVLENSRVLILGFSFKENCKDYRNTKVADIFKNIISRDIIVDVVDPYCEKEKVLFEYGIELLKKPIASIRYDAIILAVPHREFLLMGANDIRSMGKAQHVFLDLKSSFPRDQSDARL